MPRICYVPKNFGAARLAVIEQANAIIDQYAAQGYDLTLRQLYYQFVSRDLIPNRQSEYKRLGDIVNDGRLAGLIDWNAIVDRTRGIRALSHWDDPAAIIEAAAESFRLDRWAEQPLRIEVWIEKDALVGVFEPVCQEYDVSLFSCRGYTSQSELWGAAQRLEQFLRADQRVLVLHFGDHDPSGLDMTRDIEERLRLFLLHDWVRYEGERFDYMPKDELANRLELEHESQGWDLLLEVRRLALTFDQVQQYQPPPNPAKDTDARFARYVQEHGDESWELDALEPTVLGQLVRDEIEGEFDRDQWGVVEQRELSGQNTLRRVSGRWGEVEDLFR